MHLFFKKIKKYSLIFLKFLVILVFFALLSEIYVIGLLLLYFWQIINKIFTSTSIVSKNIENSVISSKLNKFTFRLQQLRNFRTFTLNFGPQHPAAHGVLRLILTLDGENIVNADPHIGLLHRGTEKLMEYRTYLQALPYFDRLDYVSILSQEYSFILSQEILLHIQCSKRVQYIRVIFLELTRLLNHLIAVTTHALDVGALTPFLYGFEEREKLIEFYERVSGARMHAAWFRIGGISQDISVGLCTDIFLFCLQFVRRLDEIEELLTNSRIWKQRLVDIGKLDYQDALNWGVSGPLLRSVGLTWDLRITAPTDAYRDLFFFIPVSSSGDCYDRYLLRIAEIRQSVFLICHCLQVLSVDSFGSFDGKNIGFSQRQIVRNTIEGLINHFKLYTEGYSLPAGNIYTSTESPKGELGVYLVSDGTSKPYRCKIKSPAFSHLQILNYLTVGHIIPDLVTIIGTLDIVFGEVDR